MFQVEKLWSCSLFFKIYMKLSTAICFCLIILKSLKAQSKYILFEKQERFLFGIISD